MARRLIPMGDRYTITERVDAGGMAEVFRGVAESMQGFKKAVAIKKILPSLTKNKKFVQMFLDEARLSLHLQHANVVHVFDIGMGAEAAYFIVMEYVDGANLKALLDYHRKAGKRIKVAHTLYLLGEVCKGLGYAHDASDPLTGKPLGIVHRDISPPNILISKMGEVKLVDFGLAKATSQLENTDPGVVKGKFSYLSPEAASGLDVDHRADIFAVGILLWEMLTGRRLFYGETDYQTVELVRQARIPSVSQINPEVGPELEAVVMKALARRPEDRFQNAADLGDALSQYQFANGLKVTNREIAALVKTVVSDRDRGKPRQHAGKSLIDVLIMEEIAKFTSLDDLGGDAALKQPSPMSPEDPSSGMSPLDPDSFEDPRNWADDVSTPMRSTAPVGSVARKRSGRGGAAVKVMPSDIDSLQQILEPDRTGVKEKVEPKGNAVTVLVVVAVLLLAALTGGVYLYRDRLFPAPSAPTEQGR